MLEYKLYVVQVLFFKQGYSVFPEINARSKIHMKELLSSFLAALTLTLVFLRVYISTFSDSLI